jgi:replicative DNA helicase
MEVSGLVDKRAILQVIGCLLQDSSLIDDIDRPLDRTDFNVEAFYELLFVAIYNLHMQGVGNEDEFAIDSYLSNYKEQYKIFQDNNGLEYLSSAREMSDLSNYDYNYHRIRKYSLLRFYEKQGLDTRFIYDSTITDGNKAEAEQIKFDNYTEQDIVGMVEATFVIAPNMKYCINTLSTDIQASDGMWELVEELQKAPDIGIPLNNNFLNTVARGARLGCLYMRSAPSGFGKSRLAAGDACKFAVPYVYDTKENKYVYTGFCEPTVYFTTEMTIDEIQSLFIAAISKVNEAKILNGTCDQDELIRIKQAIQYIKEAPLYIVHIPDFNITDITNKIKQFNREKGVKYYVFDYIHSSLRLMSEINGKSGGGLKEYQMLLVFATELKTIAQQLGVFILTASQVNSEIVNATYKDAGLLQGSKSLQNKLDVGLIACKPTKAELKKIEPIIHKKIGMSEPNLCYWIYKLRRGKLTHIVIWTYADLGTMTETPLFVTDYDLKLIDIDLTRIESVESKIKDHSIAITQVPNLSEIEQSQLEEIQETKTVRFDW